MKNKKVLAILAMAISMSCVFTACGFGSKEEEQVVVDVVEAFPVGEVSQQPQHGALCQREILEALLFQDASVVECLGEQ